MAAAVDHSASHPIRSVDRVCDVLDTLANSPTGATLGEVAEATSLPKSSAFRYLTALAARHYVERDADAVVFRLGPAFRPQHTRRMDRLVGTAQPLLEQLRDRLGETTNLGVLDGTMVSHAIVCESRQMMRLAARVGDRAYVHSTALGKAICAQLPRHRVQSILDAVGMPALGPETIASPQAFFAELEQVRALGFGVDHGENQADGRCVAVALVGMDLPAGVSVSAPAHRLSVQGIPAIARALRRTARDISAQLAR
jgi:IclR family acetate operon transcriptional repressor